YETNVFEKYGDEADAEIARIISQNAGPNANKAAQVSSAKTPAKMM
ncbi:EmrA/EmrK family multidrug efflux transporter periplasmic adaptor subunit, partial [Paraburkholderia sp. SIMBA_027]